MEHLKEIPFLDKYPVFRKFFSNIQRLKCLDFSRITSSKCLDFSNISHFICLDFSIFSF